MDLIIPEHFVTNLAAFIGWIPLMTLLPGVLHIFYQCRNIRLASHVLINSVRKKKRLIHTFYEM